MSATQPAPALTPQSVAVVSRYSDGYTKAKVIAGIGSIIKIVGIVTGVLVFFGTLSLGVRMFVPAVISGAICGGLFYLFGIFVAAQGEILMASLDCAVNSSPFLTNEQRAKAMSIG